MIKILFSVPDKVIFNSLEKYFSEQGISSHWADTAEKTLSAISGQKFDLVILNENQPDMSAKKLLEKIMMINAMINCMILSNLPEKVFHDTYEGMGVLMKLPLVPGREDLKRAVDYLNRIYTLSK
jgi:DNA-binding response OmpR family regulator